MNSTQIHNTPDLLQALSGAIREEDFLAMDLAAELVADPRIPEADKAPLRSLIAEVTRLMNIIEEAAR